MRAGYLTSINQEMEGQMHFKLLGLFTWAAVFIAFTMSPVPTAHAQQLEDRIRTLEEQLSNLKEQQIELKTEATAAAAAMPAFNYRPGNGLLVEASDKSWSLRTGIESHFRLLFQSGRDRSAELTEKFSPADFVPISTTVSTIAYGSLKLYWI
jgi:hypothetical protein